jgi:hypothetical protein
MFDEDNSNLAEVLETTGRVQLQLDIFWKKMMRGDVSSSCDGVFAEQLPVEVPRHVAYTQGPGQSLHILNITKRTSEMLHTHEIQIVTGTYYLHLPPQLACSFPKRNGTPTLLLHLAPGIYYIRKYANT